MPSTAQIRTTLHWTHSPYMGVQLPVISEYAPIGDAIGQAIADAVIARISINSALARSQSIAQKYMVLRYTRTP